MELYKYQGAGNDFLIADNRDGSIILSKEQISLLCNRRYGVGADGLMLLENSATYDFRMVYYNADGSGGMMCGNGGRCIVAFAADLGYNLPKAVVKPRLSAREDFKYLVQIEIGRFDGSWNKTADLDAWWTITGNNGNVLLQQKSSLSAPLGEGYDALVQAQSRLLAELAAQIAPAIARLR